MDILTRIMSLPYIVKYKAQIVGLKLKIKALEDDYKNKIYKEYIKVKNESDINAKNKQIEALKQTIEELRKKLKR